MSHITKFSKIQLFFNLKNYWPIFLQLNYPENQFYKTQKQKVNKLMFFNDRFTNNIIETENSLNARNLWGFYKSLHLTLEESELKIKYEKIPEYGLKIKRNKNSKKKFKYHHFDKKLKFVSDEYFFNTSRV